MQLLETFCNTEGQHWQCVVVSVCDAALLAREMPAIAYAVLSDLAGHIELLPVKLSAEAGGRLLRILQLTARSKSVRMVYSETVDGVFVEQVQSWKTLRRLPLHRQPGDQRFATQSRARAAHSETFSLRPRAISAVSRIAPRLKSHIPPDQIHRQTLTVR